MDQAIEEAAKRQCGLEAAKAARIHELLKYTPETGIFTWQKTLSNRAVAGSVAGYIHTNGYRRIRIDRKSYAAHQLAFLWMTGAFPGADVDHVNGVRDDNRWNNLRKASRAENLQNIKLPKGSKSGYLGVSWSAVKSQWHARITCSGVNKHLGYFQTPEKASSAYLAAKASLHTFQPIPR